MSTRHAKQLIYGALYLIIILFIVAAFYFIFINPFTSGSAIASCTINTCAPTSTAMIATSSVSVFASSPDHYTFLTSALDTDPDFGVSSLDYQIDVYDTSGALIGSVPAQSFIYQSQQKYLVVPNIAISQPIDHATLEITNAAWIASSTLGVIPQFVLQNTQVSMSSSTVTVSGQLTNANLGSFEKVIVVTIFNNGNANSPIGASQTELDNVQAQSTANFSITYPAVTGINPTSNQVIVYGIR